MDTSSGLAAELTADGARPDAAGVPLTLATRTTLELLGGAMTVAQLGLTPLLRFQALLHSGSGPTAPGSPLEAFLARAVAEELGIRLVVAQRDDRSGLAFASYGSEESPIILLVGDPDHSYDIALP
ncbi:hypothetical protein ACWCXB_25550 [Streptomyces sp. NPDC001514]